MMNRLTGLFLAAGCAGAAVVTQPNPLEIVRRSLETMQNDWRQAPSYSYVERDARSKREAEPVIKSFEVLMVGGSPYRRLIAVDDRALSAGEQAEEDRQMRKEIEKRQREPEREQEKRIAKYVRERRREHDMMREMVNAFQFRLEGDQTIDGHDCWVLEASPKPGYEPTDRESRVLTGMSGRLWIDKDNYQWVKAAVAVIKPVSFYGFLAKVGPGTRFLFEQEPVTDDLWLPKRFSMQVNASALGFLNEDSQEDDSYRDYKPMSQAWADLRASK